MDPAREFGRLLLIGGILLAAVGGLLLIGGRLPLRLGRLPGDIAIEGKRGSFYFPDCHLYFAERGANIGAAGCSPCSANDALFSFR